MTRRTSIRWGAALTALAYLLGWMVLLAHNVSETHVVCLEHGDLMHGSEADEHASHADHPPSLIEASTERPSLDSRPGHEGHEHCALSPFCRDDKHLTVSSSGLALLPETVVEPKTELAPAEANRPPPVSLLRLAPKTSPPVHI